MGWLQLSLECPPDAFYGFSLIVFICIFVFFTYFSKTPWPCPGKRCFCLGCFLTSLSVSLSTSLLPSLSFSLQVWVNVFTCVCVCGIQMWKSEGNFTHWTRESKCRLWSKHLYPLRQFANLSDYYNIKNYHFFPKICLDFIHPSFEMLIEMKYEHIY